MKWSMTRTLPAAARVPATNQRARARQARDCGMTPGIQGPSRVRRGGEPEDRARDSKNEASTARPQPKVNNNEYYYRRKRRPSGRH